MNEYLEKLINNPDLKKYTIKQLMKDFNVSSTIARYFSCYLKNKEVLTQKKDIQKIKNLSAKGFTNKEITAETGYDHLTIRAIRFLHGFDSALSKNKKIKLTTEIIKQIFEDDKNNLTLDEQVVKYDFSKNILIKFRKRLGLTRGEKRIKKVSNSAFFIKLERIESKYPGTAFKFMRALVNNILIKNPENLRFLHQPIVKQLKIQNENQSRKLLDSFFVKKVGQITDICKSPVQVFVGRRNDTITEYSNIERKYGFIQKWDCRFRSECLNCSKIYQDTLFFDCGKCKFYESFNSEADWKENRKHA